MDITYEELKSKAIEYITILLNFVKSKYLTKKTALKKIPWVIGTFFIILGTNATLGGWFTNLIFSGISYPTISWLYIFLGVDMIGMAAIPLIFIKWGLIQPGLIFAKYGAMADKLFICKEITLMEVMNIRFYLPCSAQSMLFYLWLMTVIVLFIHRFPKIDRAIEFLGKITYNYFYLVLMMVKVVALGLIVWTSTPLGFLGAFTTAIVVIIIDLFTINIAIKAEEASEPKTFKAKPSTQINNPKGPVA